MISLLIGCISNPTKRLSWSKFARPVTQMRYMLTLWRCWALASKTSHKVRSDVDHQVYYLLGGRIESTSQGGSLRSEIVQSTDLSTRVVRCQKSYQKEQY